MKEINLNTFYNHLLFLESLIAVALVVAGDKVIAQVYPHWPIVKYLYISSKFLDSKSSYSYKIYSPLFINKIPHRATVIYTSIQSQILPILTPNKAGGEQR
jgi:hypothetical protein